MDPATVQLRCPSCGHEWERQPQDLQGTAEDLSCPICDHERAAAEFARSDRDVRAINQFE